MYVLLCEHVYNCHLDNNTEKLVTEPLSRNGRPPRFRYNPSFSGMRNYVHVRNSQISVLPRHCFSPKRSMVEKMHKNVPLEETTVGAL
jgi:hypothetical protein